MAAEPRITGFGVAVASGAVIGAPAPYRSGGADGVGVPQGPVALARRLFGQVNWTPWDTALALQDHPSHFGEVGVLDALIHKVAPLLQLLPS